MRKVSVVVLAAASALALFRPALASAQEDPAAAAPPAPPPPPPPGMMMPAPPPPAQEDIKHMAVSFYPLSLFIGRYSAQFEYLPVQNHAISLNPFYTSLDGGTVNGASLGKFSGFGAELGYRFYTGSKGPNGFFVAPSFLFASYKQSGFICTGASTSCSTSFTSYGAALDIGGQAVIGGFVIGGGGGLQSTKNSKSIATDGLNFASAIIAGGGLRPRALLTIGYAF